LYFSLATARSLATELKPSGAKLHFLMDNLVDFVWEESGKSKPTVSPILVLSDSISGASVKQKLTDLWNEMKQAKADLFVLSALDEICCMSFTLNSL